MLDDNNDNSVEIQILNGGLTISIYQLNKFAFSPDMSYIYMLTIY